MINIEQLAYFLDCHLIGQLRLIPPLNGPCNVCSLCVMSFVIVFIISKRYICVYINVLYRKYVLYC